MVIEALVLGPGQLDHSGSEGRIDLIDEIKKEVKMPEYASWASQDRFPTNIEAAYKMMTGK